MQSPKLTIELVPKTCWFSNVRSHVTSQSWQNITELFSKKANHHCEICAGVGSNHPVECHEIWDYDDLMHVQTLKDMICLCPKCHQVKHFGFAVKQGKEIIAKKHLMKVNNWDKFTTDNYLKHCFETWQKRSYFNWELKLDFLNQLPVKITFKEETKKKNLSI